MASTVKQLSSVPPSMWVVRTIVSVCVVVHFVAIVATYSANWRRSGIQDDVLTASQPYLIGLNWYVEMLPIEWNKADSADMKAKLTALEKNQTERIVLLDSTTTTLDRAKKRSLLRLLVSILEVGDDDAAALLLSSVIKHEQASGVRSGGPIVSVRLEKLLDVGDANYSVLYEATVKQSNEGSIQFLPVLEPQRTVPAIRSETSTTAS